jgi:hypothetical protein
MPAGGRGLARLSGGLHGWELPLSVSPGVVFAVSAVGLPQLDKWQTQQEARLKVHLEAEPSDLTIPACPEDR